MKAYKKCRKSVSWKESVQRFEARLAKNIFSLIKKLNAGDSICKGFVCFSIKERGKTRNIRSVHISERVVQRALCDNILIPILSRSLIYDNGATLKGKGISFSRTRIEKHLHEYFRIHGSKGYILLIDYSKYFDSISHEILYKLIEEKIFDEKVLNTIHQMIDAFGKKGLGLGSQISQILAIYFPNKIDHYVKEILRCNWYGRYMDDSYIICENKNQLNRYLQIIKEKSEKYGITINTRKTQVRRIDKGFVYLKCKYTLLASGKIIKRAAKVCTVRTRTKLKKMFGLYKAGLINTADVRAAWESYRGYMSYFNACRTVNTTKKLYYNLFYKGDNYDR
jgi:RNA-directed DNA polymerase